MEQIHASATRAGRRVLETRKEGAMGTERARAVFISLVLASATLLAVLEVTAERRVDSSSKRDVSWVSALREVDEAIARGDVMSAAAARHEAYRAAVAGRTWQGYLAAGDAALRLGDATQSRAAAAPDARKLYLAALFRARSQHSLDGVLQTTEAFARLGDSDAVAQGLSIAREMAGLDPAAQARVRGVTDRSTDAPPTGTDDGEDF